MARPLASTGWMRYRYHMRANVVAKKIPRNTSAETCAIPCFKGTLVRRLQSQAPDEEELEEMRVLFAALADRARLKILYALKDGDELCVCDVAHVVKTTISTASHHLRRLRDLKLLKYRNDGKMAYYSLKNTLARRLVRDVLETAEGMKP